MAGHANAVGNAAYLKTRYTMNKAMGEKLNGSEFLLTIIGHEELSALIRTAQLPERTREDVEDYGPGGMKYVQHGPIRNSGEMACQCIETITGKMLAFIKDAVNNKSYFDVTISAAPESLGGEAPDSLTVTLYDCKIYVDSTDLSTEDVTSAVRPNLRIVYNFIE
ncbi:baseplate protein [Chimaeribacter californicus]|uniref:Baseplate protein n=1 Tax=Chimaeribacter californicus TaxID=2060067 RepID=A0A2N5DTQ1_9GAMM|nr:baseplate protein [Chimaeribacter californicus]PLR29957.1 baseplate protein [Chimaeribacter californicus]